MSYAHAQSATAVLVPPGVIALTGLGVESSEAWGAAQLRMSVGPVGGLASAEAWGAGKVGFRVPALGGLASTEAWGTPTILPGPAAVGPLGGVASSEAWSTGASIARAINLAGHGIPTGEAWGSTAVTSVARILGLGGVASSEAWGAARTRLFVVVGGVASSEAWGLAAARKPDLAESRRRWRVAQGLEFERGGMRRFRLDVDASQGSFAFGPRGRIFDFDFELREGEIQTADDSVAEALERVGGFVEIEAVMS